jgi:hypothetical protein
MCFLETLADVYQNVRLQAQDDFNLQVYDFYEIWGFHKEI